MAAGDKEETKGGDLTLQQDVPKGRETTPPTKTTNK